MKIRDLIYKISGIYHAEQKLYLLVSSCNRRMSDLRSEQLLRSTSTISRPAPQRETELRLLLNEITIGETYMFRHPPQLDALHNCGASPDHAGKSRASESSGFVSGRPAVRREKNLIRWPCFSWRKSSLRAGPLTFWPPT